MLPTLGARSIATAAPALWNKLPADVTRGVGILPYIGYIGMCGPKGYGFSAVLLISRVSILADFGHFGHK